MLHESIQLAARQWLDDPVIADTDKVEIRRLLDAHDERELTDRFYKDLEFGTGGMRGVIGEGRNRMNIYTVGAAVQGLANYISRVGESAKRGGVAIAYDCRRMSVEFSRRAALVLAANGIKAYVFDALRPTPELSFVVRHLRCTAGIVITASHNPPEYNGLKVYWSDGAQVVPPQDKAIIDEVRGVGPFANIRLADEGSPEARKLTEVIGAEVDEAFLTAVDESCLCPDICRKHGDSLKIVYTPLHGTGHLLVPEALRRRGFRHVLTEPAQSKPDGEFPTVKSPNPEEPAAMQLGMALAQRHAADLVIATDPDADRAGIAVRRGDGTYVLLTGNRIGAILTYFICEQLKSDGRLPANGLVLSTIVSSDLAKIIAGSYGAEVIETLTGFKWIAEEIRRWTEPAADGSPRKSFLFGMEESYGYLPCVFVRDKDAVTSSAFIADAAAFAAERGTTLYGMLEDLFRRFGYFEEGAKSVTMKGESGARMIETIMNSLREKHPIAIAGVAVETVTDMLTGIARRVSDGAEVSRFSLPPSDVMVFALADGTKVIARPSGTEPKIKFYILVRSSESNLDRARSHCAERIRMIDADLSALIARVTA
ncbi:MAG: phospho-sugar mutase [Phycisphaerae bacterium]|nr:phospho-sugar mutase [Phycisphaerae bacterium]